MNSVTDNRRLSRFELVESGAIAFANYVRRDRTVVVSHVEAPMVLRGKGTAARLMAGLVEIARTQGLTVSPLCSYAQLWFRRHPAARDVLA